MLDHLRRFDLSFVLLFALLCSSGGIAALAAEPVPIIFDTDIESDVDDVGSVALLHALANRGEAKILAMGVSTKYAFSAPCLDALNHYFGRPDIPIGNVKGEGVAESSKYAEQIAREFPQDLQSGDRAPDAAHVYRAVLAKQPDHSVVIVTVGFLTNLRNLLKTKPDGHSPLDGRALVEQKVRAWVCMGGGFPQGREWNVFRHASASREAIQAWPTAIVFSGFELGSQIKTGAALRDLPETSPVRRGYQLYNDLNDRESWDQTAVLFAVRGWNDGLKDLFKLSGEGCIEIQEDGANTWNPKGDCRHRYLIPVARPETIAERIEKLMLELPAN